MKCKTNKLRVLWFSWAYSSSLPAIWLAKKTLVSCSRVMAATTYVPEQQYEAQFKQERRKTNALQKVFSDQHRLIWLRIEKHHCRPGDANLMIVQVSCLSILLVCFYLTYAEPASLSIQTKSRTSIAQCFGSSCDARIAIPVQILWWIGPPGWLRREWFPGLQDSVFLLRNLQPWWVVLTISIQMKWDELDSFVCWMRGRI